MTSSHLPSWVQKLRDDYEADPMRWVYIGATIAVVLLIIVALGYSRSDSKRKAAGHFAAGVNAFNAARYDEAAREFEKARAQKLAGISDEAALLHAASLFGLGAHKEAEDIYRKLADSSDYIGPEAHLGIGACIEMQGDTQAALAHYKQAREKYANSFLAKTFDVRIARLSRNLGETSVAAEIYDRLEKDTDGLWKEIARGNRRMTGVPEAATTDTTL